MNDVATPNAPSGKPEQSWADWRAEKKQFVVNEWGGFKSDMKLENLRNLHNRVIDSFKSAEVTTGQKFAMAGGGAVGVGMMAWGLNDLRLAVFGERNPHTGQTEHNWVSRVGKGVLKTAIGAGTTWATVVRTSRTGGAPSQGMTP